MKEFFKTLLLYFLIKQPKYDKSDAKIVSFSNDYIGNSINVYGIYEKYYIEAIKKYFSPATYNHMLDIGANIGNHTFFLRNTFENISCFEINKLVIPILNYNVGGYKNIKIHEFGLSDSENEFNIIYDESNIGGAQISSSSIPNDNPIAKVFEYDKLNFKKDVSFIKIDVEGHELKALNGMRKIINKCKPIIAFEFNNIIHSEENLKLIEFFKEFEYKFYTIDYVSFESSKSGYLLWLLKKSIGIKEKIFEIDPIKQKKMFNMIFAVNNNSQNKINFNI